MRGRGGEGGRNKGVGVAACSTPDSSAISTNDLRKAIKELRSGGYFGNESCRLINSPSAQRERSKTAAAIAAKACGGRKRQETRGLGRGTDKRLRYECANSHSIKRREHRAWRTAGIAWLGQGGGGGGCVMMSRGCCGQGGPRLEMSENDK